MLQDAATWADIVSKGFEVIALLVAGWWTWDLFVSGRQNATRAELTVRSVTHVRVAPEKSVVKVVATCKNVGSVAIYPWLAHASVQQLRPSPSVPGYEDGELGWPVLSEHDVSYRGDDLILEPGETDTFFVDLVVPDGPAAAEVIQVHFMLYMGPVSASEVAQLDDPREREPLLHSSADFWEDVRVLRVDQAPLTEALA